MYIREATLADAESIRGIHLEAFGESEGRIIADFAQNLLEEKSLVKIISLLALQKDEIVGHVAFSPVFLEHNRAHFAYILAPLAISPDFQNRGIGSSLVRYGLDHISRAGSFLVFVYGDLNYYSKFGFQTSLAKNFIPPYSLQYPEGWHALKIDDSHYPAGGRIFCVDSLHDPLLW